MNLINQLDQSGPYLSQQEYENDLNDPRTVFDGGFKAAVARKAARSKVHAPVAPEKTPLKSWSSNPGRFPSTTTTNDNNEGDNQ